VKGRSQKGQQRFQALDLLSSHVDQLCFHVRIGLESPTFSLQMLDIWSQIKINPINLPLSLLKYAGATM
jgi:hypothetical protein